MKGSRWLLSRRNSRCLAGAELRLLEGRRVLWFNAWTCTINADEIDHVLYENIVVDSGSASSFSFVFQCLNFSNVFRGSMKLGE